MVIVWKAPPPLLKARYSPFSDIKNNISVYYKINFKLIMLMKIMIMLMIMGGCIYILPFPHHKVFSIIIDPWWLIALNSFLPDCWIGNGSPHKENLDIAQTGSQPNLKHENFFWLFCLEIIVNIGEIWWIWWIRCLSLTASVMVYNHWRSATDQLGKGFE